MLPFYISNKVDDGEIKKIYKEFSKKGTFKRREQIKSPEELLQLLIKLGMLANLMKDWSGTEFEVENLNQKELKEKKKETLEVMKDGQLAEVIGDTLFRAFDSNNDRTIDFEELVVGLSILMKGKRESKAELHFKVSFSQPENKVKFFFCNSRKKGL